ncbi:MAG: SDR family oxidoreductase [Bdellovibrionales bacterium]|nr:SDR family oxidoreductase [Bdellovibrionales bacterium]
MGVLITGSTGYLGSYVVAQMLSDHKDRLLLLIRAKDQQEAKQRLWKSLQLHMSFHEFSQYLKRIDLFLGDLTKDQLGLSDEHWKTLVSSTQSIIHCAASLNRKSEKSCLNVNLRGTLQVIALAKEAHQDHGLRRFSNVSTVAIAGQRQDELVYEEQALDWSRSDYDPYARTKKFCEHMIEKWLGDIPYIIFRPSIILGDERFPETTQFDMARAFIWLAKLPFLPFQKHWKIDIVPANYVGHAIVTIHQKKDPAHKIYHLSSGDQSLNYQQIVRDLEKKGLPLHHTFVPFLEPLFRKTIALLSMMPRSWKITKMVSLMKVFLPYLTFNTVFDNTRVVQEIHRKPKPFSEYSYPFYVFVEGHKFQYPYEPYARES